MVDKCSLPELAFIVNVWTAIKYWVSNTYSYDFIQYHSSSFLPN
jgi:hypothetical protein